MDGWFIEPERGGCSVSHILAGSLPGRAHGRPAGEPRGQVIFFLSRPVVLKDVCGLGYILGLPDILPLEVDQDQIGWIDVQIDRFGQCDPFPGPQGRRLVRGALVQDCQDPVHRRRPCGRVYHLPRQLRDRFGRAGIVLYLLGCQG